MNLMNVVEKEFAVKNEFPKFVAGDTVTVIIKLKKVIRRESSSTVAL